MVNVSLTFHPDATSAELIHQHDGWLLWFFRPTVNKYEFFTKADVGDDLSPNALNNPGNIARYFESRLKVAGYGVTRRSSAGSGDVVAVWDLTT
jgi:hypothetical protein